MGTSTSAQLCTFWLDGRLFGLDVADVREVLAAPAVTPVPLAAPCFAGLINLRGELVGAISLRVRLGLPRRPGQPAMSVIVRSQLGPMSLLVDAIGEVSAVGPAEQRSLPATLGDELRHLTSAVYELDGQLLVALDLTRLLDLNHTMGLEPASTLEHDGRAMGAVPEGP